MLTDVEQAVAKMLIVADGMYRLLVRLSAVPNQVESREVCRLADLYEELQRDILRKKPSKAKRLNVVKDVA